jgi:5'-nucleotidase
MTTPQFSEVDPEVLRLIGISEAAILDPTNAVYTNRDLELSNIQLVGFDMDYTLAVYQKHPMEQLQYQLTVEKLIATKGYPADIRKLSYDPSFIIRGLVVDKKRGHLLKMDTHGRVWRAMHGRRHLLPDQIAETYANRKIKVGTAQYASLDTLFAMPEACLYANLIDYCHAKLAWGESIGDLHASKSSEAHEGPINTGKLFDDVRDAIDEIHKDVVFDPDIALVLHKWRSVGKRLFLLTNADWPYTDVLMNYLLSGRLPEYSSWRAYFDIIIVNAQKPSFFAQKNAFTQEGSGAEVHEFDRAKVYSGGNIHDFEHMAGCRGEQILYVGDHIYGDIVRSKKESLWRTCLVVEELPPEIQLAVRYAHELDEIAEMGADRFDLDTLIGGHRALLAHVDARLSTQVEKTLSKKEIDHLHHWARILRREIDAGKKFVRELDAKTLVTLDELELRFHPHWGRIFRERNELSRFGAQVAWYACIYTGKLTNLLQYSPVHIFKSVNELMSHDRVVQSTLQVRKSRKKP